MLSILIGFAALIALGGLVHWCLGGDFSEGARGCGGCVIDIVLAIIGGIILIVLDILGVIG